METALDSSMILDVVTNDRKHADASEGAIRKAAAAGALVICECVLAEIRPAFTSDALGEFLVDWNIRFRPSTQESSLLAGEMFSAYLRRRGGRGRVVADFLIGAHASLIADRLLTRDRGFYRDYFAKLDLFEP